MRQQILNMTNYQDQQIKTIPADFEVTNYLRQNRSNVFCQTSWSRDAKIFRY